MTKDEIQAALNKLEEPLWLNGGRSVPLIIRELLGVKHYETIRAALQSPRVPDDAKYHELCKQCWDALGITEYTGKHIAEHIKELRSPRVPVIEILDTVLEQAEDDGLWFNAKYASEGYLQQELRRLHAVIERAYAELQKGN